MGRFSKVLSVLLCLVIAISCGNTHWFCKKKDQDINYGTGKTMVAVYNMGITDRQLDSICLADGLSQNFADWANAFYIDYETQDTVFKHTYIKTIGSQGEEIYIVTEWRDSLAIIKRVRQ